MTLLYSFTYPFIHSFTYLSIQPFIHTLVNSSIHSSSNSSIHPCIHLRIHSSIHHSIYASTNRLFSIHYLFTHRDSQLLSTGKWTKRIAIQRSTKGNELRIHLVSLNYGMKVLHIKTC